MLQSLLMFIGRKSYPIILGLLAFIMSSSVVLGATETFTIPAIVGGDSIPPSIPLSVVAAPVATTQINLTWASSTDNFLLSGYQVWRDDVQIATTTYPLYSDTGLTASTTYTYYITAFDSYANVSASSSVVSTTTLSNPPPATTSTSSVTDGGRVFGNKLRSLEDEIIQIHIFPQKDSVLIQYETRGFIRANVGWGLTPSYEQGGLIEQAFSKTHEATIVGLTPGTKYHFSIDGENKMGMQGTLFVSTFTTLPPLDTFAPGNVTDLRAVRDNEHVELTWHNPPDLDFTKVRVMRNDLFFPSDTADGAVIYEGNGEKAIDTSGFAKGGYQYYTVFTYDAAGNVSSGAVVRLRTADDAVPIIQPVSDPSKNEISLSLTDITFIQDGQVLPVTDNKITIDGARQFTLVLPYEKVPEHLKTILVVISDTKEKDREFSFLLRINSDKTAYEGTISSFGRSGEFPVQISVFDYTTNQIGYAHGVLVSEVKSQPIAQSSTPFLVGLLSSVLTSYTFWFVILLITMAFSARRLIYATW